MWIALTNLRDGFEGLALAFGWWRFLLRLPQSCDYLTEQVEFWEELSSGWMREYVWPYDDWYNPTPSPQRKLRLGR